MNMKEKHKSVYAISDEDELKKVLENCEENSEDIFSEHIGLEYSTLKKLAKDFGFSINKENESINF